MRKGKWVLFIVLSASFAAAVIFQQAKFSPSQPVSSAVDFKEDRVERQIIVDSYVSVASGALKSSGNIDSLNFEGVEQIKISTLFGDQVVSPGLFFEVLSMGSAEITNLSLIYGDVVVRLAQKLDSSQLEYECCGADSKLTVYLDGLILEDLDSDVLPTLQFGLVPPKCLIDDPKVFCRFSRLSGEFVGSYLNGGYILLGDLTGLNLSDSRISNVDLRGTNLGRSKIFRTLFRDVDMREVVLEDADLDETIFRDIKSDSIRGRP